MYIARVKFWFLAFLLFSYLAGILILSIISFNEGKVRSLASLNTKIENAYIHQQVKKGKNYEFGLQGVRPLLSRSKIQWCGDLKFLEPPGKVVALASFPGSGNTWLRYLLQQATGIYTGSIYKDYGLLKNGFPAEFITNGSVLVVKTHEWGQLARNKFDKAILLVRSPGAAIQAEFNRQSGGHIGFASPDRYKRTKGKYWSHFVTDKLRGWELTNLDWLYNFTGPTHVIFYEQLVENTEHTLKSIINFTGLPIDFERLKCALSRKEGIYRRKKRPMKFDPFNVEMKERIKQVQDKVYEAIYNFATPERRKKR